MILNEIFTGTVPWGVNHKSVSDTKPEFVGFDDIIDMMIQHDLDNRIESLDVVRCLILKSLKSLDELTPVS